MLFSEARNEKNFQDSKADFEAEKLRKRNEDFIKYYQGEIEREKKLIKECLDQNFFSMAKNKIESIEEMQDRVNYLMQS
jgi:hypothetical protein